MNLTHTHNAQGRKPSLCSFMTLICSRCTAHAHNRAFHLSDGPLPFILRCLWIHHPAPYFPCVSLSCTAPLPAGILDYSRIHHHIPSFLESHWPCSHPQPGLHDFSYSSDVEGASGFLLCLQGEFQIYVWNSHQEFVYFSALSIPNSWPSSFLPIPLITMAAFRNFQ